MKFLVTQQEDSKFSFTLSDNETNIVLSSVPFNDRDACIAAIRGLTQALPNRSNYEITSEDGQSFFNVISEGNVAGTSPMFSSFADANDSADRLCDDTADEPQYSVEVHTFSTTKKAQGKERVILPSLGEIDFESLYDFSFTSPKGTVGYETFNRKDKNASFFHFNDANGRALLYSRGFDANSKREKRIYQVIAASAKDQRYEIIESEGLFYFILKERNNLEIARSRSFVSRDEAEMQVNFVKENSPSYASTYPEPTKRKSVNQYNFDIKTNFPSEGFEAVKGDDKQHYFVVKNASGSPILYSQAYSAVTPRDNGIKNVIKNGSDESKYEKNEKGGKYSFILRAGNRQEIAKSILFKTIQERDNAIAWLLENTSSFADHYGVTTDTKEIVTENTETFTIDMPAPVVVMAVAEPITNTTQRQINGYLPCESYAGHSDAPAENFRIFQDSASGEHYFNMVSKTGKVVFRSEGYPTKAARNNGLASVKKNCEIRERYSAVEENGKHYVILKAGNHQEIARSCPSDSASGIYGLFPFMAAGSTAALSFDDTSVSAETVFATAKDNSIDEYLPCESYAGHSDSPAEGIRTFSKDGMYYFSVLDKNGEVSLRSESYQTTASRNNGVASILKNRNNNDRYAEIEEDGVHYVILKAGNHQEIARSCPSNTKIGLLGFLPLLGLAGLGFGAAATMIPEVKIAPPVVEVPKVAPLAYAEPEIEPTAGGLPKWLLPLIGLLFLGLLLWWLMKGCNKNSPATAVEKPEMVDTVKTIAPVVAGEQVDGFSPVILYFDNDEPNRNSQAVKTSQTYTQTYENYQNRKVKFESESDNQVAKTAISSFFDNDVKKGFTDLNALAAMIAKNLDAGEKVDITVKGFASPLAKNEYNINLTKRRINCIRNFFSKYEGGKLAERMNKITIKEQANGEDSSVSGLSDDEKNTKLSVYDLAPSKERRVEIVEVRFVKE